MTGSPSGRPGRRPHWKSGDPPGFVPLLAAAAARYAGVSTQRFYSHATTMAGALTAARSLLGTDGIAVLPDETLLGEACGLGVTWSDGAPVLHGGGAANLPDPDRIGTLGRVPVVIDVLDRLLRMHRDIPVLAVWPGPLTLSDQLRASVGDPVATIEYGFDLLTRVVVASGETGADGVLLWEPGGLSGYGAADRDILAAGLDGLNGQAEYFSFPLVLLGPPMRRPDAGLRRLPVGLICADPLDLEFDAPDLRAAARLVVAGRPALPSQPGLCSTSAQIPADSSVDTLRRLVEALRGQGDGA